MRGVRALRKAPLVLLITSLATCDFTFNIEQPSLQLDLQAAYQSGESLQITYTFVADEPVLQCRWALNSDSDPIDSGIQGPLTSGVPNTLELSIPNDGNYLLHLVGQVKRNGSFVDMAALSQTVEFSIDSAPPVTLPEIGMLDGGCYYPTDTVLLNHASWTIPDGGSPVKLRYNFDSGPFDPGAVELAPQPGGVSIAFPSAVVETPGFHTLQVTAIDEAGNSLPAESRQFRFLKIESATEVNTTSNRAPIGYVANVVIFGFTFTSSDSVKLYDKDGTDVPYFGSPVIGTTSITVAFDLRVAANFHDGMGQIRITTTTPNAASTTWPFELY